jgi:hypothetical protein
MHILCTYFMCKQCTYLMCKQCGSSREWSGGSGRWTVASEKYEWASDTYASSTWTTSQRCILTHSTCWEAQIFFQTIWQCIWRHTIHSGKPLEAPCAKLVSAKSTRGSSRCSIFLFCGHSHCLTPTRTRPSLRPSWARESSYSQRRSWQVGGVRGSSSVRSIVLQAKFPSACYLCFLNLMFRSSDLNPTEPLHLNLRRLPLRTITFSGI